MKQQLNEEFRRMQKLAGTELGENIEEAKEDLFSKYKTKIETLRDEFVSDLKSNLKDLKKLSKEDKTKLSQMVRNLTAAVDDMLSEHKMIKVNEEMETHRFELENWQLFSDSEFGKLRRKYYFNADIDGKALANIPDFVTIMPNSLKSKLDPSFNTNDELNKDYHNYLRKEYGMKIGEKTEKGYKLDSQEDVVIANKDWKHFKDFIFKGIPYGKTLRDIKPPDPKPLPSSPQTSPNSPLKGKPIKLTPISSELWDSSTSASKLKDVIKSLQQKGYSNDEIQKAVFPSKLISQPG
jgi:hypothetical protein